MKWTKRIAVFIILLAVAWLFINFGDKLSVPFSQVIGGIVIGFALSFIIAVLVLENGETE